MYYWKKLVYLPGLVLFISTFIGCGGQAYQSQNPNGIYTSGTGNQSISPSSPSGGVIIPTPTPTTTTTPDTKVSLGYPVVDTDELKVLGTRGLSTLGENQTFTVTDIATDKQLNLEFSPSNIPGTVSNSGYQIDYHCVKFQIQTKQQDDSTKGTLTQTAFLSTLGTDITSGPCAGAKAKPVATFNLQSGHGLLKSVITALTYDNCNQYCLSPYTGAVEMCNSFNLQYMPGQMGMYYRSECPLNIVAKEHWVRAHLTVYTTGVVEQ